MALVDNVWYVDFGNGSSTGYYAVAVWSNHTETAGAIIRQLTVPAVGSERCFVCTTAGATGAVEPTWTNTRGALNTSSIAIYQECTGIAALNGDATNTPTWTITATPPGGVKNTAVTLGQVIKRDNGASYQICTIPGTAGNGAEPGFSDTAGVTTVDNTVTWTSLGVVGNFTGWQAPHARLANSFTATWGQAGNTFFVASEHAETQATAMTLTVPSALATPSMVDCVAKTPVPPTFATTGASISTSGVSALTLGGASSYWNGFTFNASSGNNLSILTFGNTQSSYSNFKSCTFNLDTNASSAFAFGNTGGGNSGIKIYCDSCTFTFGGQAGQVFTSPVSDIEVVIRGGSIGFVTTAPTTVFSKPPPVLLLDCVDLSAFLSGKTLIGANTISGTAVLSRCRLGASVTVAATPTTLNQEVFVILADSSGTNYRHEKYHYTGTQTVETTIVRTGGASDGTTPISWKIVSTANSKWVLPFECIPITVWCETTGSHTATVYGTTTGGGVPNNDDIWITAEYLKDSGDPLGGFVTTTKSDNLAASTTTNNSSDASTWGAGGAGNGFKMVTPAFTVNQKGPITIYVYIAKATTTYYVDQKPAISGITVSRSMILAPGVYANELGGGSGSVSYIS